MRNGKQCMTKKKVPKDAETISNDFENLASKLNRLSRKNQIQFDEYKRLKNNVAEGRIATIMKILKG